MTQPAVLKTPNNYDSHTKITSYGVDKYIASALFCCSFGVEVIGDQL